MATKVKYLNIIFVVIVAILKIVVYIYDLITLPVYILLQRPWIRWSKASTMRAQQLNPDDPGSPWIATANVSKHPEDDCLTVDEAIRKSLVLMQKDRQCLGYREIINEEVVYSEGKPITKYVLSDYKWINYEQFEEKVNNIAKGLLLSEVKTGDNVMIYADTSIDWFISAQSILRIGGTVATLYSSLNEEGLLHGLNETEVTHVLTSIQLLPKLLGLKNKIPKMSTIIYFDSNITSKEISIERSDKNISLNLISLSEVEKKGRLAQNDQRLSYQSPKEDDIAVLLYTSGSTGVPKGVKITHKNFVSTLFAYKLTIEYLKGGRDDHIYIAYLPLAHILEFVTEVIVFIYGFKIGYSTPYTLTDLSTAIRPGDKGDTILLKPTIMAGVPLVLDRIRKGIYDKISRKGFLVRKLFDFTVDYKSFWSQKGFDTPIINQLFCQKFLQTVGGNLSIMIVGGAPLSQDTQKLIKSCLNVKLIQGYASTETTAAGCMMDPFDDALGHVGPPLFGLQIKLIDWNEGGYRVTDRPNPRGEMVIGGETITTGYFKLDSTTEESYYNDANGKRWFLSGDIGEVFPNGTFKIIDRKKDLIKLQFGEYVSLGKIESELKSNSFVDNICVYGHLYHSYLVALIVPNQLSVSRIAKRLKISYNTFNELYENPKIVAFITNQIRRHSKNAGLGKFEIPQKIMLCSEEWTPDNGLLTAAMKIKRKNITNKYQKQIDLMYENCDHLNNNHSNAL